jgi:alkanesulfonate monooxygenase SsuD/methylene tetrahydromethanopterin reductase-like flavin-dependent oxidoreductase (luciferase family)
MTNSPVPRGRIGVVFDRSRPPEELTGFARDVEADGADDLWVVEDLGWAGSISSAALALSATGGLRIGIGIVPAPLRNPALLAMELGTLARLFPGRLVAGIGHGVPEWMERVGATHPDKLALLEETVVAVRTLLRGERADLRGKAVRIEDTALVHPPAEVPPLVAGVVRPRSLELSGRVADGTVMAEGQGPERVAAALARIAAGRAAAGATGPHELIVFSHLAVSDDPARVEAALAPIRAEYAAWLGLPAPDVHFTAGTPAEAAARVRALWAAGADTVVLRPVGADPRGQLGAVLAALET